VIVHAAENLDLEQQQREEQDVTRLQWAAMMLALDVDTACSILRGLPVRAANLDGFVLRRALRGGELPRAEDYIQVTAAMLEAVDEAGPLAPKPWTNKRGGQR
jgi:hypothetical protein